MIFDMQQQYGADGLTVFPDFPWVDKPKPQVEVGETVIIRGDNTGGSFSITGTADENNQYG